MGFFVFFASIGWRRILEQLQWFWGVEGERKIGFWMRRIHEKEKGEKREDWKR